MSDSSNTNKYYVATPSSADYEAVNNTVLEKASKFGITSHRLLSAIGNKANTEDDGSTGYKYLEDRLFSTKNVKIFKSSTKSMLDVDYVKDMSNEVGSVYKVLRFNRSHNIRAFDFVITYSQVSAFGSEIYKPIVQTKQFKGSLLFTGCSIVRDTETMEELPLKLYGKYESIGDTPNRRTDLNNIDDARGGPSITLKYTFDDNYVYLYISSISPFRFIPIGDGEYRDISYIEGKGLLTGETKENLIVTDNAFNNSKKIVDFSNDNRIWCDISMSIKDVTISHNGDNAEFIDYNKNTLTKPATVLREQTVSFLPTNDGEQIVIGIEPASTVNLDITPDTAPVRFGGSLLNSSKSETSNYIAKLKERIISCAKYTEKVAFTIKTVIRTKGKYNINGDYFIDNNADGFGQILITDIGTYNSITNSFDITEYIFDKNQTKYTKLTKVENYKNYVSNASDYLSSISDGTVYPSVRNTTDLLDVLANIDFETPSNLDVYFNVAFLKSSGNFKVLYSYAEFGDDDDNNDDDYVVYVCEDNVIRIVNFKDYNMENAVEYDLTKIVNTLKASDKINYSTRSYVDGKYVYFIGTNNGSVIRIDDIVDVKNIAFSTFGTFDEAGISKEKITFIDSDDNRTYIGGANGSISIYNNKTRAITYIDSIFANDDPVLLVKPISDDYLAFIAKEEIASYCISSNKWNYIGDKYRIGANFKNPFNDLDNPNIDYIIEKEGFTGVPLCQIDIFVYALGLRKDAETGYVPVYKKMNTLTGETSTISVPDIQLYKPALCNDTRYIYCIGGSNPKNTTDKTLTYIEIYDTVENKWIDLTSNTLTLPDNVVFESASVLHPIVHNKSVYVVHPKASIVAKNIDTGGYAYQEKIVNTSYEFTFDETTKNIAVSTLNDDFENNLDTNISVVPFIIDKNKVHYFSASPDLSNSKYNGYKLKKYIVDFDSLSVSTSETVIGSEYEFAMQYASGNFTNAPDDLFKDISIYREGNECIVFLLSRFILYIYSNDSILLNEIHAVYHNAGTDAEHLPLITNGAYDSWKKYNKNVSSNINMLKIGNYVVFIGGDTGRVPDYLSLDSISLIPSPSFYERSSRNAASSILNNTESLLNVVPDDSFTYDELATCTAENTVYLVAFNKSKLKSYLMKYDLSDPIRKPRIIKDITSITTINGKILHNLNLQYFSDLNVLLIASVNSISTSDKTTDDAAFNLIAYNVSNGNLSRVIEESDAFTDSHIIYPIIIDSNTIDYVSDKNIGYKISILSGIISKETINSGYVLSELTSDDVTSLAFAKNIYCYNKSFFIVNKTASADIECIDASTKTKVISYSIPNSKNYINGDIFKSGNYIYATKGVNGSVVGNDIFRFDLTSLITENGGENTVKHALLDASSSRFLAPMAITKTHELIVFGLARPENSVLKVFHSKFDDSTFIPYITEIDISHNKSINYNRFNPKFTSFEINGAEILMVFGGTQSLHTKTTKTVDIYNTKRHTWLESISLPAELSHINICENMITGATYEDLENATSKAYPKKISFISQDDDGLSFTTSITDYPNINGLVYPKYAKYCLTEDGTILYIVPTLLDGTIDVDTKKIYRVNLVEKSFTDISSSTDLALIYSEAREVIGIFATINNLIMITFDKSSNTLGVSKYNHKTNYWSVAKNTVLPFTPITNKEYSSRIGSNLSVFENLTNIVKNDNGYSNRTKAILSLLNNDDNHIYNLYFSYDASDNLYISSLISDSNFSNGLLSDIDEIYINPKGFTYIADRTKNKIYRLFPNNDTNAFGIKSINYLDAESALSRTDKNDLIASAKSSNGSDLIINISDITTGISNNYTFDLSANPIDLDKPSLLKIVDNALYLIYSSTDKTHIVKLMEIKNGAFKAVSGISIIDISDISSDYSVISNILGETKIYFKSSTNIKVYDILNGSTNTYNTSTSDDVLNVFKENNNKLYFVIYRDNEFIISHDGICDSRIKSSLSGAGLTSDNIRVINNTVYLIGPTGYLYELVVDDTMSIVKLACLYSTEITKFSNDLIIRNTDILDISKEIKYTNPNYINNSTYCFDDDDINYYDEVISSLQKGNERLLLSLYSSATHRLISQITLPVNIDINHEDTKFISKVNGIYKLNILKNGKLIIINYLDSSIVELENDVISSNYEPIHIQYSNKFIIGNNASKYIVFDPNNNTITEKEIHLKNHDYKLKQILFADDTFKKYFALIYKTDESYYCLGKFDSGYDDIVYIRPTKLLYTGSDVIKRSTKLNEFFLISDHAIKFSLNKIEDSIDVLEEYSNYNDISKRDTDSLITLNNVKDSTRTKNEFIYANKVVFENEFISAELDNTFKPIVRNIDDFHVIICKEAIETEYSVFFLNTKLGKCIKVSTDIKFSNNMAIDINNRYFDSVLEDGIVKLYHIIDTINGEIRDLSIKISDQTNTIGTIFDVTDEDVSFIYNDELDESHDAVDTCCRIFNVQNSYIAVLNNCKLTLKTLSSSWKVISASTVFENTTFDSEFKVFVSSDIIFVINPSSTSACVIENPCNGSLYNVDSFENNCKSITLPSRFYENISLISDNVIMCDNSRYAKCGEFGLLFDTILQCSEFYNEYVGVSFYGEPNAINVPMNKYDIGNAALSDDTNTSTYRSKENVKVYLNLLYKSSNINISASISAISRLNTSKFAIDHAETDTDKVGKIYAFSSNSVNGELVRNDVSYYDDNYSVAIINDKTIRIKINGETRDYNSADNEIPLSNEILPIVISYGEFINSDDVTEGRYYSFIDIKGNIVTYDKELQTFIDISGSVDVNVPYYSTEAMIYQSYTNLLDDTNKIIKNIQATK